MPCCPSTSAIPHSTTASVVTTPMVHLHLHVADLAQATAFYRAFLGAAPVKERPGYVKFLPGWAPLNLALSQADAAAERGPVSHLGIQLSDPAAVRQHLGRIQAAGLATRVEMGVECCYANQDKFWVRDPAGIEWEVYHLNHDIEHAGKRAPAEASCCAPGCCVP